MITITIDGGAGTGKGTTAKGVAKVLGYQYIDTGAMYRGVALEALKIGIDPNDEEALCIITKKLLFSYHYNKSTDSFDVCINGKNQEHAIRTPEVTAIVHIIAKHQSVRRLLVQQQQRLGKLGGVVFDGRDCGTVIAPHAELKIHLICDLDIRAKRRQEQYMSEGKKVDIQTITNNLYERDQLDLYGPNATNYIADDAIDLDTTNLSINEQIQKIVLLANSLIS